MAGEIVLSDPLYIRGSFLTLDGFSAPVPGITLKGHGLYIHGSKGAHDVIVRGIRVRDSADDGIQLKWDAYNIVIDHVSIQNSADGNLDITRDSHDITVSWSIFARPAGSQKNVLIKYNPSRITLHHNIFVDAAQRNPQVRIDDAGTPATDTTLDMRNNLVWGWGSGEGTLIWYGPWANVADNFYDSNGGDGHQPIIVCQGDCGGNPASFARAYVAGNLSGDGFTAINSVGNEQSPFLAPALDAIDACAAAYQALAGAGVRPLDSVDRQFLSLISLPPCVETSPADLSVVSRSLSVPYTARAGSTISIGESTKNFGAGAAGASTTRLYISTNTILDPGDLLLGGRAVPRLASREKSSAITRVTLPATLAARTYYIIAVADADDEVAETKETNNARRVTIKIY